MANYAIHEKYPELITVNDALYGSTQLDSVKPCLFAMSINRENHGDGQLKKKDYTTINWDLAQKDESDLFKIITASANEIAQIHAVSEQSGYKRRAFKVEFVHSTMQDIPLKNLMARTLQRGFIQWDRASYAGFFGNFGVLNNPKRIKTAAKDMANVGDLVAIIQGVFDDYLIPLGWSSENMNNLTVGMTSDVKTKLAKQIPSTAALESSVLDAFLTSDVNGSKPNMITFPPEFFALSGFESSIEITINTLTKVHHASMPSLYVSGEDVRTDHAWAQFSFETAAFEIEERGAVINVPLNIV